MNPYQAPQTMHDPYQWMRHEIKFLDIIGTFMVILWLFSIPIWIAAVVFIGDKCLGWHRIAIGYSLIPLTFLYSFPATRVCVFLLEVIERRQAHLKWWLEDHGGF